MIKRLDYPVTMRYSFIGWLLLMLLGGQACAGLATTSSASADTQDDDQEQVSYIAVHLATSASTSGEDESLVTATATKIVAPKVTATPSKTATPTFTPSRTQTPTPTHTPTKTPIPTDTPLPTDTPTPTSTLTPGPTPVTQEATLRVPILMYHYLSTPPSDADIIRRDLSVSPEQFEAQLAYLRQAGYETIALKDLAYFLSIGAELPPKPIILTFDDGYRDNYDNAFPLLQKYGYTATFFIFTQPIDTYNINYLTWEMVIEMHQAGMEFGAHSYRHLDMDNRDVDFLVFEILASKEAIEARINEPVRFFSYPAGRYDALTIKVLESANFWGAVTTHWGIEQTYEDRFELLRLRMHGNDTVQDLANKLKAF